MLLNLEERGLLRPPNLPRPGPRQSTPLVTPLYYSLFRLDPFKQPSPVLSRGALSIPVPGLVAPKAFPRRLSTPFPPHLCLRTALRGSFSLPSIYCQFRGGGRTALTYRRYCPGRFVVFSRDSQLASCSILMRFEVKLYHFGASWVLLVWVLVVRGFE